MMEPHKSSATEICSLVHSEDCMEGLHRDDEALTPTLILDEDDHVSLVLLQSKSSVPGGGASYFSADLSDSYSVADIIHFSLSMAELVDSIFVN
jgi:hypothetical protein